LSQARSLWQPGELDTAGGDEHADRALPPTWDPIVPSHLSFEAAATLSCAAVTAWVALTGHRPVTADDTVLTQGSGASVFALQFDRVGARLIRDHLHALARRGMTFDK
jgi:hypothetical protein